MAATAGRMPGSSANSAAITASIGAALRTPATAPAVVLTSAGPGERRAPSRMARTIRDIAASRKVPRPGGLAPGDEQLGI